MSAEPRRVFEVFSRAAALAPAARTAYLDEACADDADLHEEVVRLLQLHDDGTSDADPLEGRLRDVVAGEMAEHFRAEAEPPGRVGPFRVVRRLGAGGMGTVFLAEQDEPRRHVALKVLRTDLVTPQSLQRFELEAQLLARLHHPSIAQIYAAGRFASPLGPLPYLAMEFVDGRPLLEHARSLDLRARLELFAGICDAVQHAHQNGVIHRDLKPGNILVEESGRPKVLDFGVSRAHSVDARGPDQTATGQVIGTLDYMSPEQASGLRAVDTRTDVYSLGVVGFELLSGRLPRDMAELPLAEALRVLREVPAPALESVDRGFRGDLSLIFAKALETDPERRYASAAALADDVRRHLADQTILARRPTLAYQLRRFVRRNRTLVAAAVLALVSLAGGLVVALVARAEEAQQRTRAERESDRSRRQEATAKRAAYAARIQAAALALRTHDSQSVHRKLEATAPEARSWEWRHLKNSLDQDLGFFPMALSGRPAPAFAQDGSRVAAFVDTRTVRCFDYARRRWSDPIKLPFDARAAALPGDGQGLVLAAASQLWACDAASAASLRRVASMVLPIRALRPMPARDRVAVLGSDAERCALHTVDPASGACDRVLEFAQPMAGFDLDADASHAAFWHYGRAQVWSLRAGRAVREFALAGESVALSGSGSRLAHWGPWGLGLFPVEAGHPSWSRLVADDQTERVIFAPDERRLVSAHLDATLRFWDARTGACAGMSSGARGSDGALLSCAFSPDRTRIHAIGLDGAYLRPATPEPAPRVLRHRTREEGNPYPYVYSVRFSPDGRRLVTAGWDGTARIWDVATGRPLAVLLHTHAKVEWALFSADGRRLLSCARVHLYNDARLSLWDAATGRRLRTLDSEPLCNAGVAGPGDGWTVSFGKELRTLDPVSLAVRRRTVVTGAEVRSLARSPDGALLACGTVDGCVVLKADTLTPVRRLDIGAAVSLAFSPDGKRLAAGGGDGTLEIRDLTSFRRTVRVSVVKARPVGGVPTLTAASGAPDIYSVAFTRDGRRVACGSRIGAIQLFDAESGGEIVRLTGHGAYVHGLAFHPRGEILASASGDNTARLWDARPVAERLREQDRVLAAEASVRAFVDRLFARLATREAVAAAVAADPDLDPLERHAAGNLVLRR